MKRHDNGLTFEQWKVAALAWNKNKEYANTKGFRNAWMRGEDPTEYAIVEKE